MTQVLPDHLEDCSKPQYFCCAVCCEKCRAYRYSKPVPFSEAAAAAQEPVRV